MFLLIFALLLIAIAAVSKNKKIRYGLLTFAIILSVLSFFL